MTDREKFEKWWGSEFNCAEGYGAFEAWQARGECQCQACVKGIRHDSDCAVHNAPAYPVGECNCSVIDKKQWVGLSDEEIDAIFPLGDDADVLDVARGIEAKLREKNG